MFLPIFNLRSFVKYLKTLFSVIVLTFVSSLASAVPYQDIQDDCSYIRNSVESLKSTGGTIKMRSGLHICQAPIFLYYDNITLDGGNPNSTTIKLKDYEHAPILIIGTETGTNPDTGRFTTIRTVHNVTIKNLTIDGNKDNHDTAKECFNSTCDGDAFSVRNNSITVRGAYDAKIYNVVTHSAISGGLVTERDVLRLHVKDFESYNNHFDGIAGYETENSLFEDVYLHDNKGAGVSIDIRFSHNHFLNSRLINNHDVGIFARDLTGNLFENLSILNSGSFGVFMAGVGSPETCAKDNEFRNVKITGSYRAGLRVNDSCQGNKVTGQSNLNGNNTGHFSEGKGLSCISEDVAGTVQRPSNFQCLD